MLVGVYGAGGFGRDIMPLARAQFGADVLFVDDGTAGQVLNGNAIVSYDEFRTRARGEPCGMVLAVSGARIREELDQKCRRDAIDLVSLRAANALIGDSCVIGEGSVLCPFTYVTANVTIGRAFQANYYAYVAHDCVVGDYVTFAPGAKCNGNVHIGGGAYVGSGAVIRQGKPGRPLTIGAGAVIGMGAVVIGDVPAGATVVGNPARLLAPR